ncbi:MAG: hypothetical protein ACREBU_08185 [Nitrososphaera sp.]
MPRNNESNSPIASHRIRRALSRVFTFLEKSFQDELMYELDLRGIHLFHRTSYTLDEIENALDAIFGEDGTKLIMERIRAELRKE